MNVINIPEILHKMNEIFESHGFEAYLVGGAVRDSLLNKDASDWDVTTNAKPEQVQSIFHKVIPTGIAHGTVTVHFMGKEIEVTTYRCEEGYSDGRHPDNVSFTSNLHEDLSRRDFTINAIAASLKNGEIIDPFNGQKDLEEKCIRTVGSASDRFMEDGLRPVRAIRFSSQLGFTIEQETLKAISNPEIQEKIKSISMERFRDELVKILKSPVPSIGLKLLEQTGILKSFIPELIECRGCKQQDIRGFHDFDVLDHIFYTVDGTPQEAETVRLAALFHDIGKRHTKTIENYEHPENSGNFVEIIHFHKHDMVSAEEAVPILTRLKFPNSLIKDVTHLIRQHMFFFEVNWTDAAVRRFIVRLQPKYIDDLFLLRYADIYGMHREKLDPNSKEAKNLETLKKRINIELEKETLLSLKDMKINGSDLIQAGIPKGETIGLILQELFQCILEKPEYNNKEKLLELAQNFANTREKQ